MTALLVVGIGILILWIGYLLTTHADLKLQAENLAKAVIADSKAEAKRIAKQISGKVS